jgi:hypothetical protein
MPQILFVVEVPPSRAISSSPGYPHEWTQFANAATAILKPLKGTKMLQLNAWLMNAENSLPAISELSALATHHKLSYSALLISDELTPMALDVKPKS